MAAGLSVDHDVVRWLRDQLEQAEPDLLREMVKVFAEAFDGRGGGRGVRGGLPGAKSGAGQLSSDQLSNTDKRR